MPARRGGMLAGTPVAFVLGLLLTACQGAGPPDVHELGQNSDMVMRVADDTAAGGDLGTAASLYRRAADLSPQDPRPLAKLGAVLLQLHAYTEAAATYRAALKITPNPIEPELHRGLGVVLLALDQPQAALTELDAAVAKAPEDARLFNALGVAHDLLGHHDLAQQDYRNGLRLAPDNAGLRNNYALSLALSHDYPAAVATLSPLAERSDASPRHRLNLALIYGLAGDDGRAAAVARTTLDETAVANNLAYYAMLRGMDDRARANAIMGGQSRGPAVAEAPKSATAATAVAAAPATPVSAATLPPPVASAAPHRKAPAPVVPMAAPEPAAVSATPAVPPPAPTAPVADAAPGAAAPAKVPPPATGRQATAKPPAAAPAAAATVAAEPWKAAPARQQATAEPPAAMPAPAPAALPAQAAAIDPAAGAPAAAGAKPAPEPAAAPDAQPAAGAPATTGAEGFVLQLGSFSLEANARHLAEHLSQKGYEAVVLHRRDRDGREWFVVRAGAYASADVAAAAARHIREAEQVPAVVVHLARRA